MTLLDQHGRPLVVVIDEENPVPEWIKERHRQAQREADDERLLAFANETLDNAPSEYKTIPPCIVKGKVFHPNLNGDGTWRSSGVKAEPVPPKPPLIWVPK